MKSHQYDNLILESDALDVVRSIHYENDVSPAGLLVDDCRSLLHGFNQVILRFVKRSANKAAHLCARAAYSMYDLHEWDSIPAFLFHVIIHEC